jgi:hypothetical protein
VRNYGLPPPRTYQTAFCARCGSLLPTILPEFGIAMLPAGAIDTPLEIAQAVHIYVGSKAAWQDITDTLPQFAEMPPPERFGEFFL